MAVAEEPAEAVATVAVAGHAAAAVVAEEALDAVAARSPAGKAGSAMQSPAVREAR